MAEVGIVLPMILSLILCLHSTLVLSQGVFPDAPNTTVNIVVMAPFDGEYLFRKELVEPSVDYAMASIRRDLPTALRNIRFNITYRDSHCSRKAAVEAVNFYYGRCGDDVTTSMTSPILFLGPVCNDAASMVATFAENWNVPIISPGAHAAWLIPGGEYPLLNRITPSYTDLSYFIHGIFLTLMHGISYPVHLVYSDDENGRMTERECHNVMQAIYTVFNNDDIELQVTEPYVIRDVTFQPETFITELGYPRVVLMCAPSHLVRKVMLAAAAHGVAVPGRNDWYAIDLHNDSYYAAGAWRQGDDQDVKAKVAYRALQVITLLVTKTAEFNRFSATVLNEYRRRGITSSETQVNEYVEGFHDALILYTRALNTTIHQGLDIRNGTAVAGNMRNLTFPGISGPVFIDLYGDRYGDYSIIGMRNKETGTFERVVDYHRGKDVHYTFYPDKRREWKIQTNRMPPFSDPVKEDTGFDHRALTGVLGTLAGVVMCCLLVGGPLCYRLKGGSGNLNNELSVPGYNNNQPDAVHIPLREDGSVSTCMSGLDDDMKV